MASSEKIGATDEEKIVDAYTQAEVFLHEGDYVKVLEITEATISVHGANPSCYRHHLLQGDSMMDSKLCTCLKPSKHQRTQTILFGGESGNAASVHKSITAW